tara:strand:+ start:406 stop:702 length:297 start_codon:yes stop_codon:yes gene_type:complete
MLQFHLDPESLSHKTELGEQKTFSFYCASGGRSALAAKSATEMGMRRIVNLTGGFMAWTKAGDPISEWVFSAIDDGYPMIYELQKTYDKWCYCISDKF